MQEDFIVVIGLGYMGGALANGLLKSAKSESWKIGLHDTHVEKIKAFRSKHAIYLSDLSDRSVWPKKNPDAIILCIKPHDLSIISSNLQPLLSKSTMVISILAGVNVTQIAEVLNFSGAIVRVMPNIPASIQLAASALTANERCSAMQKNLAERIFNSVGESVWLKEPLMDTVTGLSGSGPAYIYMVIEAMIDGGVKMGLPRDLATKLTVQTVLGAASLVKSSNLHPAILKDMVTTPAGTTISALHVLEERGLRSMFVAAVEEATNRSKLLGKKRS